MMHRAYVWAIRSGVFAFCGALSRMLPLSIGMYLRNAYYDWMTYRIMRRCMRGDSIGVDVGAHRGTILSLMETIAPRGKHIACEPLPMCTAILRAEHPHADIIEVALSNASGTAEFFHIRNRPSWSGLHVTALPFIADVEKMTVRTMTLDEIVPRERNVAFVKIDAEGAELDIIQGGKQLLLRNKPVVVFEAGDTTASTYGHSAEDFYRSIVGTIGFRLFTVSGWLHGKEPHTEESFRKAWRTRSEWYFVAAA